jgi:protein gp37
MADVFEKRDELDPHRERLWKLIEDTPYLDWLLLTKRIEQVETYVPWGQYWPANVWLGASVENQKLAEERIPILLSSNAHVKFLSCEPLLGNLHIQDSLTGIDWVIAGGESGGKARPTSPEWLRSLRNQCSASDTAFHFKQWGNWFPMDSSTELNYKNKRIKTLDGAFEMVNIGKKAAGRILDGREWNEFPLSL